jgi:hypothetical protein
VIPTILPTAGLVTTSAGGLITKAVGTVDAVAQDTGHVVGDVVSTTGQAVGAVAGTVGGLLDAVVPEDPGSAMGQDVPRDGS